MLYFYLLSQLDVGTECEAAKRLGGAFPVQYFILMYPCGVRGVSGEEQWKNAKGTFVPGEKQHVCEREVQREQKEEGTEGLGVRDKWRKELKGGDEQEVVGGRLSIGRWRTCSQKNKDQKEYDMESESK